jgi:hypothetical protein
LRCSNNDVVEHHAQTSAKAAIDAIHCRMTVHARNFSASARTLADLRTFMQASPKEAQAFLREVGTRLHGNGLRRQGAILTELGRSAGDQQALLEKLDQPEVAAIFPSYNADVLMEAGRDGRLSAAERRRFDGPTARAVEQQGIVGAARFSQATLRIMAGEAAWTAQRVGGESTVVGKVSMKRNGGASIKLDGKNVTLVKSSRTAGYMPIPPDWMAGLTKDGPVVLQGTHKEGKFFVESFAPHMDGLFDNFLAGRINTEKRGKVFLSTPRGDVFLTNPTFIKKMEALPRLAMVVPGEAVEKNGRLEFDGNPTKFLALGRPNGDDDANGHPTFDIAFSVFARKPVMFDERPTKARLEHGSRCWLLGDVNLEGDTALSFTASYLSLATDGASIADDSDYDPLRSAIASAEVNEAEDDAT